MLITLATKVEYTGTMESFRDMHIDVQNICGKKFSARARVYDMDNIEICVHNLPEAQKREFDHRISPIRLVRNYSQTVPTNSKLVKSLSDLCFKVITIHFKRPFRKIKNLTAACILRDNIIDSGLTLNLQKNYGAALLEYKLPLRFVADDNKRIRLKQCVMGHSIGKIQLNRNYYIDYFCKNCLSDCFMYENK
ncbi:hypothetical protein [Chrysodeixis includens nucleopolyhedrovirus]|uniref:Uncharacterized protein n=1 Tax=Chrysodeixis includens nucleopolyhedrovirus TaxID=1207438 RepID=A0A5B8YRC4_9ABAC|nr:hypothetical protein QKU06_gp071 [Chrysodeixis includens nucleopolyhedrovirus]QED40599.1 hypothetical protein [Chrysodeixis includens nucleopolyhedrovirus]